MILLGIDRNDNSLILLGAIPAALLAILFDFLLRFLEKASFKSTIITISAGILLTAAIIVVPYFASDKRKLQLLVN